MNNSSFGFVAGAALLAWPIAALVFFSTMRPMRAALFTIFGALLFLPELEAFKLPLWPSFDKTTIAYQCALLGCIARCPERVLRFPRERWVTAIFASFLIGGIGTAVTNTDPLTYGIWHKVVLPGLNFKAGMAMAIGRLLGLGLPFFIGAALVRERRDVRTLLTFLVSVGLLYSFFALVEMRMSPQFNVWIYGYHQYLDFNQAIRFGGYRPMVFMAHGLAVALFFVVTTIAAAGVSTFRRRLYRIRTPLLTGYLVFILVACRSTAAVVYGLFALPLLKFASPRMQIRAAALVSALVLLYPAMRAFQLFPVDTMLSLADGLSHERSGSLEYRFQNEDVLLEKGRRRPWFGWGEFNRNGGFDGGGNVTTVTDGAWIIAFGTQGAVGFVGSFGLLVIPIFLARSRLSRVADRTDRATLAALALAVAVPAIDLIPNGLFSNYPYFLSGALLSASRVLAIAPEGDNAVELGQVDGGFEGEADGTWIGPTSVSSSTVVG
jgi:hypothetical protein